MFGLKTPIAQSEKTDEFDSLTTILSQSSVAKPSRIKRAPPWLTSTGENGGIFHLELPVDVETSLTKFNNVDDHSVSSLALGAGCNSEDTGYSSDQDLMGSDHHGHFDKGKGKNRWGKVSKDRPVERTEKLKSSKNITDLCSPETRTRSSIRISASATKNHNGLDHVGELKLINHNNDNTLFTSGNDDVDDGVCLRRRDLKTRLTSVSSESSISNGSDSTMVHIPSTNPPSSCKKQTHSQTTSGKCVPKIKEWKSMLVELTIESGLKRRGLSLCEDLLGIVPGKSDFVEDGSKVTGSHDVIIKAIVPDGPASQKPEIVVGSWLTSINGHDVTWTNMDFILSTLGKLNKVKLAFKTHRSDKSSLDFESLVNVLDSGTLDQPTPSNVAASYISLKGVDLDNPHCDHDGVMYSYPKADNSLLQLHGLFYTLAHLVKDMDTKSEIRNSTIELEGQLVHIAYLQENEDVLIFAMPASCASVAELNAVLTEFSKFLRLLYGSVDSAFEMKENSAFIDNILSHIFNRATSESSPLPSLPSSSLPSSLLSSSHAKEKMTQLSESHAFVQYSQKVPCLTVSTKVKMTIDKIMNEFESSCFHNMSESSYGCRRQYTILGSVYFYCGYMVTSHMASADLADIHNYLQHLGILHLMKKCSVSQFVAWQEVHPTRFCHDVADINNSFGYSEPNARWCALIIGLKRGLFCCLLETIGMTTFNKPKLSPDISYVDQAKSCLLRIQSPQLIGALDISMNEDTGSAFTKSDYCATYVNATGAKTSRLFNIEGMKMKKDHCNVVSSFGHQWTNTSISSTDGHNDFYNFYKSNQIGKMHVDDCLSSVDPFQAPPSLTMSNITLNHRFSSTRHPLLYHYCCLDGIEGTAILNNDIDSAGIFCSQVVHGFYKCCRQIHEFFTEKSKHYHGVREHGILMSFNPRNRDGISRDQQALSYWVVGRQMKSPQKKEIFACFHETTSQSLIELAFRHNFGSLS